MVHSWVDELQVENIEKVALIFFDFDLLNKWFKEDVNWNALILADYVIEISEHELSHLELFMIFDEQESQLFVYHWSIGIFLAGELVQKTK
jgi:hypothetical protein